MRIFLIVLGVAIIALGGIAAVFPMSVAADLAARQAPDFKFASATGSIWNGALKQVMLGREPIGDIGVRLLPGELLKGRMSARVNLTRPDAVAEGDLLVGFDGKNPAWRNFKMSGKASAIPGLPARLAGENGQFSVTIEQLDFKGEACTVAKGEAWTNVLALETAKNEAAAEGGWTGPELRGPISCVNGTLFVDAAGVSPNGETVTARINVGRRASLSLDARVTRVGPDGAKALSALGFRPDGADYVLSHRLGSM